MEAIISDMPLVSVRVPAYNHGRYIERCLNSVLEDEYPNKELVVIDDGSTDDTDAQIRAWISRHGDRIDVRYTSRPNRGLGATLNELIAGCRGQYLVSLASDDFLLPGGIARRVEYLEKFPAKHAVMGDCIVVDAEGRVLHGSGLSEYHSANKVRYKDDAGLRREVILNWAVPGPVLMVRKSLYEQIGGYDPRLDVEDWDLYLRMVSQNLLGFINYPVSAYRVHAAATSLDPRKASLIVRQMARTAWRNSSRFQGIDRLHLLGKAIWLSMARVKVAFSGRFKRVR